MAFDIQKLRSGSSLDKVKEELEKLNTKKKYDRDDTRFWSLKTDKAGNGSALIRFLPAAEGDDVPWVRIFHHSFEGPGGWYIENSLTTINQSDPLSEYNRDLWNSGIEANKDLVRKQKRKLSFVANILVIKDPACPENDGKVFLYKFGKKIFDKIQEQIDPVEDPIKKKVAFNPFCPFTGANFMLRARKVAGYQNYDTSEFESPSALFDGDEKKILEVHAQEYSVSDLVAPSEFKPYEQLKARLDKVLGVSEKKAQTIQATAETSNKEEDEPDFDKLAESSEDKDYLNELAKLAEGEV